MSPNRYRLTFALLGLALAGVVVGAVILAPSGRVVELPEAIESIAPEDGATVLHQTQLEIDMKVGYAIEVFVDGIGIPIGELDFTEATGKYVLQPVPGSTIEEWQPGVHSIFIRWDRTAGLPDPGEWRWTFRVQ